MEYTMWYHPLWKVEEVESCSWIISTCKRISHTMWPRSWMKFYEEVNHEVESYQHGRESVTQSDLEVEWSLIMKFNHEVESFQHGNWLDSVDRENS